MYKHILLDLDDTIFDFQAGEAFAIEKMLKEFKLEPSLENIHAYNHHNRELWKGIESGETTKTELLQQRFPTFLAKFGLDIPLEEGLAIDDRFRDYLVKGTQFMPGAQDFLKALKELHQVKIYAATNGVGKTQRGRLQRLGLEDYFDKLYISEEIGYNKPDKRFFDFIIKDLAPQNLSEVVMIGDSLTSDMEGSRRSGLEAIWFNAFSQEISYQDNPAIVFAATSLKDILAYLMTHT